MTHEAEIAHDTTSPLASTIAKINGYSRHFKLHLGMPDGVGWRRASEVVTSDSWLLVQLECLHAKHPYYPKHVVAMNFYNRYQWYLVTAGVAGFLLDARVPNLGAESIAIRLDDDGWVAGVALLSDAFACLPDDDAVGAGSIAAFVVPDREALRQRLAGQVWGHMRCLIPLMQLFTPVSAHVLRAATANSLAGAALWMLQAAGRHAIAEAESRALANALPFPTRVRFFAVECDGERELYLDGGVCCHYYLRPDNPQGEYCANCPKVPLTKRIAALREYMAARQRGETLR
ncbi:MAG: IucA/IucC family C-terminal-domain containing protein [Anaerolineae bacterium]|nr:hypothetical protein [Candidatus Roseilinea sp.]MDW8449356.1 IucA/IucC family C-terminal-domain containing protein [Anaerolineae bacterium]